MFKIEDVTSNGEIVDFLTQKINEENPEFGDAFSFSFLMRDDSEAIIAGCHGSVVFGEVYTDMLWVHPAYRSAGLGRQLMEHVQTYGRSQGCTMATVSTMSFQKARRFYEKLGYQVDFERTGYTKGATCFFLKKLI